jgi:hypothetical protein
LPFVVGPDFDHRFHSTRLSVLLCDDGAAEKSASSSCGDSFPVGHGPLQAHNAGCSPSALSQSRSDLLSLDFADYSEASYVFINRTKSMQLTHEAYQWLNKQIAGAKHRDLFAIQANLST